MKIGLFFGTFNPIHVGHLIIANHMAQHASIDQVWLVVTPHNPHKEKATLLSDHLRLDMVRDAIFDAPHLKASDIEFHLPKPNYTISTLTHLQEKHSQDEFCLLLGEDNLRSFHKWYNWDQILAKHRIYVYPRQREEGAEQAPHSALEQHPNIEMVKDVPILGISASFVRKRLASGKDCSFLLTEPVAKYIADRGLYQK
ncbi:MAG: nicotinate-nucleotide adenylyltransferase [Crocinitomicaceae bacterium]|nr:nicotinate-nucleotide adenylyltransferase [Crocinitomicaceae bacterium]